MHLFLQDTAANTEGQPFFDPLTIGMLLILAVLIFFMFRNSRKRKAQAAELQDTMQPGSQVMTNFGMFGLLVALDEDTNEALIEVSPGTTIRVHRQVLARVVEDETVVAPAEADVDETPGDAPEQRP